MMRDVLRSRRVSNQVPESPTLNGARLAIGVGNREQQCPWPSRGVEPLRVFQERGPIFSLDVPREVRPRAFLHPAVKVGHRALLKFARRGVNARRALAGARALSSMSRRARSRWPAAAEHDVFGAA